MEYTPTFIIGDMLAGNEQFVQSFVELSTVHEYRPGHTIVRQGEKIEKLFLVLNGTVEGSFYSENGQKKIIMLNKGRWFFGASAFDGNRNTMNYTCLTPVITAAMDPKNIDKWDSDMLLTLAKLQKQKERILNRQLKLRAFNSVDERVLCVLRDLAHTGRRAGEDRITHQMIAEIVGATRVQVTNCLKKYSELGMVSSDDKGNIFLTDKGLQVRVNG